MHHVLKIHHDFARHWHHGFDVEVRHIWPFVLGLLAYRDFAQCQNTMYVQTADHMITQRTLRHGFKEKTHRVASASDLPSLSLHPFVIVFRPLYTLRLLQRIDHIAAVHGHIALYAFDTPHMRNRPAVEILAPSLSETCVFGAGYNGSMTHSKQTIKAFYETPVGIIRDLRRHQAFSSSFGIGVKVSETRRG